MKLILALVATSAVVVGVANFARIGYPFRGPGYSPDSGVAITLDGPLVVALTDGTISKGSGRDFFRELNQVMNSISGEEGLIGYSVRKELLGNKVWTQSAWTSHEAVAGFVRSESHLQAIRNGGIKSNTVSSVILEVPARDLPLTWKRVEEALKSSAH